MHRKKILKSIAAAGLAIGGANVLQNEELIYAAELEQTEQEAAGELVIELELP